MITKLLLSITISFFTLLSVFTQQQRTDNEIYFADPTIYVENGKYYLSGTKNSKPLGFAMMESTNLKDWSYPAETKCNEGMILTAGSETYGKQGFWAPQFLKENNRYYFTYTASSQVVLASADALTGPYLQTKPEPIDGSVHNIDSYLFKDDDGKYYLYHVRFNHGNYIWVAEFDFAKGKIKAETLKQCFTNTEAWEKTPAFDSNPIMEGPTVVKLKGVYYLFYSANHFRSMDYAVGYATAKSPYGPWTKHPNSPIIHRTIVKENGAGHGDFFFDKQHKPWYVYHVHYSDTEVGPRRTRIVPLEMKMNKQTGIYDIKVKADKIIKPVIK
ncbi:MAG: glycoside hydrolase family 43 protein [Paludibacter sp.]|nr:glycoside hydrolase family 43 protein [Paludibacter sp.]